jgi:hypothetical protein
MLPAVEVDHSCPVGRADDLGLLAGSPMQRSWCLSFQRDVVAGLSPPLDPASPELLLWDSGNVQVYYAPWDWVNTRAKVMLVGITPGAHQAVEALREARRCLAAGYSNEETLRRADAVGSFSGPMRANLVTMLDGAGLAIALGLDSTGRLFGSHHHLAAHVSAIDYPVFVNGRNYGGRSPSLTRHPVLRSLVRASLGARLAMAPDALVVPLGAAARDAIELLATDELVDPVRCLWGFPHASRANGWRARQYAARQPALAREVALWAATTSAEKHAQSSAGLNAARGKPSLHRSTPHAHATTHTAPAGNDGPARILIPLTSGGIGNSYLSLADHLGFFPADAIGAASAKDGTGKLLTLHLAGLPDSVHTDIAAHHKIFRKRQPWKRFFNCHSLIAGDSVIIERLSAYEYEIMPASSN